MKSEVRAKGYIYIYIHPVFLKYFLAWKTMEQATSHSHKYLYGNLLGWSHNPSCLSTAQSHAARADY